MNGVVSLIGDKPFVQAIVSQIVSCEADGMVSLLDVQPFVQPFVHAVIAGTFLCEADVNEDGVVDLLDIAPFVQLLPL